MKQILKIALLAIIISNDVEAIEMIKLDTEKVNSGVFAEDCPQCQLIPVSLEILISEIVKNNYDLNSKKMEIDIASHQIKIEEGIFEPILNLETDYIRTKVLNSAEEAVSRSDMSLYKEKKYFAKGEVKGLLEIGTEWSINITDGNQNSNLISETRDYDREFDNDIELSITTT